MFTCIAGTSSSWRFFFFFFFQAEDGIRDRNVTGVQTCALPIYLVNEAWLLPLPETTLRRQVERAFLEAHAPLPRNVIESVSMLTHRVLLRKSDSIGIMP